jgi:hypothetical protein
MAHAQNKQPFRGKISSLYMSDVQNPANARA